MNRDTLLTYFKASRDIQLVREGTKAEDILSVQLDDIWYNQFEADDRRMVELLLVDHHSRTRKEPMAVVLQNIIDTLQEKPTMLNVFANKEDYLKLKDFWKTLHAEKKYKPVRHEYIWGYRGGEALTGHYMKSPLEFRQHLVYLAATGKCMSKATKGMWAETIREALRTVKWARNDERISKSYYFDFFGEAIGPEHYETILNRIEEHLTFKKMTFGQPE